MKTPVARKGESELYGLDLFTQQTATLKVNLTHAQKRVRLLSAWVYLNLGLIYTRYFVLSRIIYRELKRTTRLAHTLVGVYIRVVCYKK